VKGSAHRQLFLGELGSPAAVGEIAADWSATISPPPP
jgi:hypothetical protein